MKQLKSIYEKYSYMEMLLHQNLFLYLPTKMFIWLLKKMFKTNHISLNFSKSPLDYYTFTLNM